MRGNSQNLNVYIRVVFINSASFDSPVAAAVSPGCCLLTGSLTLFQTQKCDQLFSVVHVLVVHSAAFLCRSESRICRILKQQALSHRFFLG